MSSWLSALTSLTISAGAAGFVAIVIALLDVWGMGSKLGHDFDIGLITAGFSTLGVTAVSISRNHAKA